MEFNFCFDLSQNLESLILQEPTGGSTKYPLMLYSSNGFLLSAKTKDKYRLMCVANFRIHFIDKTKKKLIILGF